jgi:hypothetical protein
MPRREVCSNIQSAGKDDWVLLNSGRRLSRSISLIKHMHRVLHYRRRTGKMVYVSIDVDGALDSPNLT